MMAKISPGITAFDPLKICVVKFLTKFTYNSFEIWTTIEKQNKGIGKELQKSLNIKVALLDV